MTEDPFVAWAMRKQAEYVADRHAWCSEIQWPIAKRKRARKPEPGELDLPPQADEG